MRNVKFDNICSLLKINNRKLRTFFLNLAKNMILKKNLLESLSIMSSSGSVLCILLYCFTNISPITGLWMLAYLFSVFVLSFLLSLKSVQWLLHLNKPIRYDFESLITKYPLFGFFRRLLPKYFFGKKSMKVAVEECKEYDTNELSIISTVLEKKLVSSWYVPYISEEIGFPFACKQMLDQMIGKAFKICSRIDAKDVYVDLASILVSHLKEYRKALKKQEKLTTGTIESHYKKRHSAAECNRKYDFSEHCTNILRVVLKELESWELWDTPHSELLVRILSKRLNNFIESTLIDPDWLNTQLLTFVIGHPIEIPKEVFDFDETVKTVNEDVTDKKVENLPNLEQTELPKGVHVTTIESALSNLITKSTAPILQRAIANEMHIIEDGPKSNLSSVDDFKVTVPMDIKCSPVLRQRRGRQGKNEVKIYDRIIEGSVKTWDTDVDLQCISLGQDLLASLDGEITLSRLWEQDVDTDAISPQSSNLPSQAQGLWFGEEDSLDMELNSESASPQKKEPSPTKKEHSPKPTEALLKDIQSTVNQAKTKIGDLQVALEYSRNLDVSSRNQSATGDEAAGMMEGLLDFGIAGFKKGLRFTGLHDDKQDNLSSHLKEHGTSPVPISPRHGNKHEDRDYSPSTVIQRDDNGPTIVPPLMKQQRVSSQDSVVQNKGKIDGSVPVPIPVNDSPELEYEDPADLSTSIAKLRSLLQQRTAESPPIAAEAWWGGAEEMRARTQHSSRHVDTATLADEYDTGTDRSSPQGQDTMQRLDKLFQRTVTGVFNSLRTAVGAEGEEQAATAAPPAPHHWTYVCTPVESSVGGAVARLVGARRAHAHVDAALDSLEQLAPAAHKAQPLDDFEDELCACGRLWCGAAEAAAAARLWRSHVAHRLATLLVADLAETAITNWLEEFTVWLKEQIFTSFEEMAKENIDKAVKSEKMPLKKLNIDETCAAIMNKLPGPLYLFGEETLNQSVRLIVTSFSHKEINKDLTFRVLDLLVVHFKRSAGVRDSFDIG